MPNPMRLSRGRPPTFKQPHKKAQGRPPSINTIRVTPVGPGGTAARLVFSWDIVERLLKLRDGKNIGLNNYNWHTLYLDILTFTDMTIPGVFVKLKPRVVTFKPTGIKLTKRPGSYQFRAEVRVAGLWLKPGFKTQRVKTLWIRNPAGIMLVFDDEDMMYQQHKAA